VSAHGWAGDAKRGDRHIRGYGTQWDKLRPYILARDDYLCQVCSKQDRTTPASEVDHIIPKADGGTDDEDNLQSICIDCHKAKTLQERTAGSPGCAVTGEPIDQADPWNVSHET
jgi:5-methylcytosine-specific restriction protein A